MKEHLLNLLPDYLRSSLRNWRRKKELRRKIWQDYEYDFERFMDESAVTGLFDTQEKLRTRLVVDYHKIEKGLSLKRPRVGFGRDVIERLLHNLRRYCELYVLDDTALVALNALYAYYNFNKAGGQDDLELLRQLKEIRETSSGSDVASKAGGVREITRVGVHKAAKLDLREFFQSRHSIRQFSPESVDLETVREAIRMAQQTPSVCNRQSCKVYVFETEEDKKAVLCLQDLNR